MPIVSVHRDKQFDRLGCKYSEEEFDNQCFEYGIEKDEIVKESEVRSKDIENPDNIWYKIDVPANRQDLQCIEGISRALNIYQNKLKVPDYKPQYIDDPSFYVIQDKSTIKIRPYIVCAVQRNMNWKKCDYTSFIDLQDKLHFNIGKRRTLISIGTHDLNKIIGPIKYTVENNKDIKFIPLMEDQLYNVNELYELYDNRKNNHLKPYLSIIRDKQIDIDIDKRTHPVIRDNTNNVISQPPIINSEYSKMETTTRNIFIECTAMDIIKANIAVNTIVSMFSEYCNFEIYKVKVCIPKDNNIITDINFYKDKGIEIITETKIEEEDIDNITIYTPNLESRIFTTSIKYINSIIGLQLDKDTIIQYLKRMQLKAKYLDNNDNNLQVYIPCTRSDILHPVDIAEDIAIAYGYNNIPQIAYKNFTLGKELPVTRLSNQLRNSMISSGYIETITWVLVREEENYEYLQRINPKNHAIIIENSKVDFTSCRTTLLIGLLKVIQNNKYAKLPIRIFEIGDIVIQTPNTPEGSENQRNIAAMYVGQTSGLEEIHSLITFIMNQLHFKFVSYDILFPNGIKNPDKNNKYKYTIYPTTPNDSNKTFLEKRSATVYLGDGNKVGEFGIINPTVLEYFNLDQHAPCSAMEQFLTHFI